MRIFSFLSSLRLFSLPLALSLGCAASGTSARDDAGADAPPDIVVEDRAMDVTPEIASDVTVETDGGEDAGPECALAAECEGRPHDGCEGAWTCTADRCVWQCAACMDLDADG